MKVPEEAAATGHLVICARRFPSKLKGLTYVPEGYKWGYRVDYTEEALEEFFEASMDSVKLAAWRKKALEDL